MSSAARMLVVLHELAMDVHHREVGVEGTRLLRADAQRYRLPSALAHLLGVMHELTGSSMDATLHGMPMDAR